MQWRIFFLFNSSLIYSQTQLSHNLSQRKNSQRQNWGQKPFFQSEQWNCFLVRQGLSQGCDTLPNVAHIFAFSHKNYKISWVTCPPGINFCICICICTFSSSTFLLPRVCRCCPPRMRESFCLGTAWLYRSRHGWWWWWCWLNWKNYFL